MKSKMSLVMQVFSGLLFLAVSPPSGFAQDSAKLVCFSRVNHTAEEKADQRPYKIEVTHNLEGVRVTYHGISYYSGVAADIAFTTLSSGSRIDSRTGNYIYSFKVENKTPWVGGTHLTDQAKGEIEYDPRNPSHSILTYKVRQFHGPWIGGSFENNTSLFKTSLFVGWDTVPVESMNCEYIGLL